MATEAGVPCWVDLGTSDLEAAKRFYTGLFGWTAHVSPEPEAQGYTIFNRDGKPAAGAGPQMSDQQPTAWATYVATDDAEETARKVEAAGGKTLVSPFDVMKFGRMAVFLDQADTAFSVWQASSMPGAEVFGEPGSFGWAELTTRDPQGSKDFYGSVFGWSSDDRVDEQFPYTFFRLHGQPAAGMITMTGDMWPPELPNHWMNYFNVEDCDDSAAQVIKLGGTVAVQPTEIPPGRFAVVSDPQGAFFSIIKTRPDFDFR